MQRTVGAARQTWGGGSPRAGGGAGRGGRATRGPGGPATRRGAGPWGGGCGAGRAAPGWGPRLAELATREGRVVIYGPDEMAARPRRDANVLVPGLRERLPHRRIVAIRVAPHAGSVEDLGTDAARLGEFVATG